MTLRVRRLRAGLKVAGLAIAMAMAMGLGACSSSGDNSFQQLGALRVGQGARPQRGHGCTHVSCRRRVCK